MHVATQDPAFRGRIEQLRASNQQLRQELELEIARFGRTRRSDNGPVARDKRLNDLTPRELEVLQMIAKGYSTRDLARHLGIAFKTAACHRHRLMQKLEVHTASSLVRIAIGAGLVEV